MLQCNRQEARLHLGFRFLASSLRFRIHPHPPLLASELSLQQLQRVAVRRLNRKRRWAYEGAAGGEAFSSAWASETRQRPLCCCLRLACPAPSLQNRSRRARGPWISKASWVQFLRTSSPCMPASKMVQDITNLCQSLRQTPEL